MAFKNIFCCGNVSLEKRDEDVSGENDEEIVQKSEKMSKKLTKAEILSQEIDELDKKLQLLTNSLNILEDKYEDTENQIMQFFGRCVVEKLETKYFYTAPPIMVMKKRNDGTIFPSFSEVKYESENPSVKESSPTNASTEVNAVYQVRSLMHCCQRMFYLDATSIEDTVGHRRFATDLAIQYSCAASQNEKRGVYMIDQLLPLRKLCYMMLVNENKGEKREVDVKESQEACENEKITIHLTGNFGQTNTIGLEMATERRQLKDNLFGASGLLNATQPLQNRQAVLHEEILTTVDFPFRVSLRDIMLRNRCIESHAKFLCINLLMTITYLHSRNIIHGNIAPSTVIFTQFGYPCLIDVESDDTGEDQSGAQPCIDYTSPEQVKDEPVSAATDIFLMGILAYSTIYGKSPFKADTYTKTRANILDETFIPEFDSDTISKDGRLFIRKLLKMNPDSRFKPDSCTKPLDKAVKWFSTMNQHELRNQTYPSPFKEFMLQEALAD